MRGSGGADSLAATVRRPGPAPDVVELETHRVPPPGPGQVWVRMRAAAINPSDLLTIAGVYGARFPCPYVAGFEGVGVVERIGAGVVHLRPGLRVWPLGSPGAWQTLKLTEADWCFPVNDGLADHEVAMGYINPLTALLMLTDRASLTPGDRVVVSAAGSAIGRMLLRLANRQGVRPVAILRHARTRTVLAGLDLAGIVVADGWICPDTLRAAVGGVDFDLALDAVGGPVGQSMLEVLRPGGRMLHYGLLSGTPIDTADSVRRDVRVELVNLRSWVHGVPRERLGRALQAAASLVAAGTLASTIERVYPLSNIRTALHHAERPGRLGKILLACSSGDGS